MWVGESDDGKPMLYITDSNGKIRFAIRHSEGEQQQLVINDQNGNTRLLVGESRSGRPMLCTIDSNGKRRFELYQTEAGRQLLVINDRDGNPVRSMMAK